MKIDQHLHFKIEANSIDDQDEEEKIQEEEDDDNPFKMADDIIPFDQSPAFLNQDLEDDDNTEELNNRVNTESQEML